MKKITLSVLLVAVFLPALLMATPVAYVDGNNFSLAYGYVGYDNNNGYDSHNNHSGYDNNNGHDSHNNHSGYDNNNGYDSHNNHSGYDNNNGHDSHNNQSGYNNHNSNKAELRRAHRAIKRLFMKAENAYYPFFMSSQDKRKMGRALRRLSGELSNLVTIVRRSYRGEVREVKRVVENARFALISEYDANRAHRKLQRAERKYNRLMNQILY